MNSKQEKDGGKKQETEDLTQVVLTKRGLKNLSTPDTHEKRLDDI